ncbi:hypothetical protein EGW08_019822, partial [Elysia chlorotica]
EIFYSWGRRYKVVGTTQGQFFLFGSVASTQPFSIDHVRTLFTQSLQSDARGNTVLKLDSYIEAYTELSRVFDFFGVVFSFAREDIMSKLSTLTTLRTVDRRRRHHYDTFESMFAYEYSHAALLQEQPGVSCNRWIHRALRFISRVVEEVKQESSADLQSRVRVHYDNILAPHHSWFVRSAARLALNSFPSRDQFLSAIHVADTPVGMGKLTQAVSVMDQVYNHVQGLYDRYST